MSLVFPRISKENPETSGEHLQRHSFNHPSSSVLGAEIPCLLNWPRTSSLTFPKENLLQIASKIYVFSLISLVSAFAIQKSLFLWSRSCLYHFWCILGSWLDVLLQTSETKLLCADYFVVHIMKVQVLLYSKRLMWCWATFGYVIRM